MPDQKPEAPQIQRFSEIVEANGKTIRENNMAKKHRFFEGQEVNVLVYDEKTDKYVQSPGYNIAFILHCGRDCDGTPLYWVGGKAQWDEIWKYGKDRTFKVPFWGIFNRVVGGLSERCLEPSDLRGDIRKSLEELEEIKDLSAISADVPPAKKWEGT